MIAKVNGKLLSLLLKMILNLSNLTEEMEKRLSDQLRYLTISAIDEEWGIVVTTVGYQFIPPKGNYPLSKHGQLQLQAADRTNPERIPTGLHHKGKRLLLFAILQDAKDKRRPRSAA
jgi:hypothetical protein